MTILEVCLRRSKGRQTTIRSHSISWACYSLGTNGEFFVCFVFDGFCVLKLFTGDGSKIYETYHQNNNRILEKKRKRIEREAVFRSNALTLQRIHSMLQMFNTPEFTYRSTPTE